MTGSISSMTYGDMDDAPVKENTIQFESPSHTGMLLSGLNSLRNKNLLVDVTLRAGGQSFEVCFLPKIRWLLASGWTRVVKKVVCQELYAVNVSALILKSWF